MGRPTDRDTATRNGDTTPSSSGSAVASSSDTLALVVIACRAEQQRLGEALLVPQARADSVFVFGRGGARKQDPGHRLLLVRQRPGRAEATEPIEDPHVSRTQLALRGGQNSLLIENLGRRDVRIDGAVVTRGEVAPGAILEIDDRLAFLCVRRPGRLPGSPSGEAYGSVPFACADASGIVGESVSAWDLRREVAFAARQEAHVLITGATGTGKELIARALHALSARNAGPFVARNAATFPATLVDAELFGHAANYPNAGMPERFGIIGEAKGGTLFLDEIGELPEALQSHLLRVLDEGGEYQRLGDPRRRAANVRVVGATNRPLEQLKADLAARLRIRIASPPLGARAEDVPLLARHVLRSMARADVSLAARFFVGANAQTGEPRIRQGLLIALVRHEYTAHVRELESLLWRALASSTGDWVDLTPSVAAALKPARGATPTAVLTRETIQDALDRHGGNQSEAWKDLGLANRYVLRRLVKKHGLGR